MMAAALVYVALTYIPRINDPLYRGAAWMVYGFVQGLVGTGLWILAHECGHGAFSLHTRFNNIVGWAVHSALMVPYFSWKFSHARHHKFTGHMEKDMAFVPSTKEEYSHKKLLGFLDPELFEDVPLVSLLRLIGHQLFGWQLYLLLNSTSGPNSLQNKVSKWWGRSHFDPNSAVFRPNERIYIVISDIGLLITGTLLYHAGTIVGPWNVFLLWGVPYFWVHHWLGMLSWITSSRKPLASSASIY
jgi:bifunctional Delta-12/omega-3 fatty acid desaturase